MPPKKIDIIGGEKMGFSYTNKKGLTYHLHNKGKLYFFSKEAAGSVDQPPGTTIIENPKTGLPMLKKK